MTTSFWTNKVKCIFPRWVIAAALVMCIAICTVHYAAAEGPAVSGINGKASALLGHLNSESTYIALGSLSLPLGEQFGLQIDLTGGQISSESYSGAGAHLFWRDPDIGLIGLTSSYQSADDISKIRQGVEGEYYLSKITFYTRMSYQYGDVESCFIFKPGMKIYPMDNLALKIETGIQEDDFRGKGAVEYQILNGLTLFAEAQLGSHHYDRWFGGARFYFGDNKSLKRRHREDDPEIGDLEDLPEYEEDKVFGYFGGPN